MAQVLEWYFLQPDLPLPTRGVPRSTLCVVSALMEPVVEPSPPNPMPRPPPPSALF